MSIRSVMAAPLAKYSSSVLKRHVFFQSRSLSSHPDLTYEMPSIYSLSEDMMNIDRTHAISTSKALDLYWRN